jgi:serine/threonine protein kinase
VPTVPPEFQADFNHGLKLFFEEGRALTGLDHPNVVRVLNFFRANGTVYLVMRFETGRTLRDHVRKHWGRLTEAFLRKMFSGLLDGLGEVHGQRAAASGHQAGQHLAAYRRQPGAAGLRRRALRRGYRPARAARHVHPGLCRARAVPRQVHAGARGPTSMPSVPACMRR